MIGFIRLDKKWKSKISTRLLPINPATGSWLVKDQLWPVSRGDKAELKQREKTDEWEALTEQQTPSPQHHPPFTLISPLRPSSQAFLWWLFLEKWPSFRCRIQNILDKSFYPRLQYLFTPDHTIPKPEPSNAQTVRINTPLSLSVRLLLRFNKMESRYRNLSPERDRTSALGTPGFVVLWICHFLRYLALSL